MIFKGAPPYRTHNISLLNWCNPKGLWSPKGHLLQIHEHSMRCHCDLVGRRWQMDGSPTGSNYINEHSKSVDKSTTFDENLMGCPFLNLWGSGHLYEIRDIGCNIGENLTELNETWRGVPCEMSMNWTKLDDILREAPCEMNDNFKASMKSYGGANS